jgi:hypothetical protein
VDTCEALGESEASELARALKVVELRDLVGGAARENCPSEEVWGGGEGGERGGGACEVGVWGSGDDDALGRR